MTSLPIVSDGNLGSVVLRATRPVIAAFVSPSCVASTALLPIVERLADEYAGRVQAVAINAEDETLLVEQFNIACTPTLLVVQHGEPITRAVGFAPLGLIRQLFADVASCSVPRQWLWSPTEELFEEAVIAPLLQGWGWQFTRQAPCPLPTSKGIRGRIDFLAYDNGTGEPLTLFENKRQIASQYELQQAVVQARTYAVALNVGSFVVAAPSGMWIYAVHGKRIRAAGLFSSLELHTNPQALATLLLQLRRSP
jgi:thiol-disulfide isomerase/thioredoxin